MRRRAVLRADAGGPVGFGHFVRTVALASYLRDDFDCVVTGHTPDGVLSQWQLDEISAAGARPLPIAASGLKEFDALFLDTLGPDDIAVLDNYYFDAHYQSAARERCAALVCIDDTHARRFTADAVVSFCPLPREKFNLAPYTRLYTGLGWAFLRAPFLSPAPPRVSTGAPRRIMTAIGGTDPLGLTAKICRVIGEVFPEAEIHLPGDCDSHIDCRLSTVRHGRLDAAGMARLMDSCDLGVFPASTLCVEAISRRLPVVAGWFVDNQRDFYEAGTASGWMGALGPLLDPPDLIEARLREATAAGLPSPPDIDFAAARRQVAETFNSLIEINPDLS